MYDLVAEAVAAVLPGLAGIAHPSDVLDMPVDPNEPTYCLCHQVSYGEMIGCDNPDVSIRSSNFHGCIVCIHKKIVEFQHERPESIFEGGVCSANKI